MEPVPEPTIVFTPWGAWKDRASLKESGGPCLGVYLWGRFDSSPDSADVPYPQLPEEIIYVGDTKHLEERPLGGIRHHRLVHYSEVFPDDPLYHCLYVSIFRVCRFPAGYDDEESARRYQVLRVFTQYMEGKLYWEYTKKWGHPPGLHYKKGTSADPVRA